MIDGGAIGWGMATVTFRQFHAAEQKTVGGAEVRSCPDGVLVTAVSRLSDRVLQSVTDVPIVIINAHGFQGFGARRASPKSSKRRDSMQAKNDTEIFCHGSVA